MFAGQPWSRHCSTDGYFLSPQCKQGGTLPLSVSKSGEVRCLKLACRPFLLHLVHPHLPFRMLGDSQFLRLPPWGGECGACLMDYAPAVHKLLEQKVEAIVQSYIRRKEFVAAFLSVFGQAVLEYDTEGFKKLAFLFEQQGFTFITISMSEFSVIPVNSQWEQVDIPLPHTHTCTHTHTCAHTHTRTRTHTVELTDEFPQEAPLLILRSVYHRLQGLPCQCVLNDYPYSPRWNADEKAERTR